VKKVFGIIIDDVEYQFFKAFTKAIVAVMLLGKRRRQVKT